MKIRTDDGAGTFAQAIIDMLERDPGAPIDSCDRRPVGDEKRATFVASRYHDAPGRSMVVGHRGTWVHTVTVETRYVPAELAALFLGEPDR